MWSLMYGDLPFSGRRLKRYGQAGGQQTYHVDLPASGIRGIMELALGIPDVIRLEIGDPDFTTPEHIIQAAAAAARDGLTHYGPSISRRASVS